MYHRLLILTLAAAVFSVALSATVPSGPNRKLDIPAFKTAGQTKGVEIWRVENFKPVAVPKAEYGKFYTGDSYIVLNTVEDKNKKKSYDAHFWLGLKTTQDEAGAAAILTVQLDDLLSGVPVQHREVEGSESDLFLSYFKGGVRYLEGGVASGFKHVETNAAKPKRLFQIKGNKNIRVRQVELAVSAMNKGDCFILDADRDIYVYVGPKANRIEKLKAINVANDIRDQDHAGRAKVHTIDEFSSPTDQENFFNVLGSGSPNLVPEQSAAKEDAAFEKADAASVSLYKVTDSKGGKLAVEQINQKPLKQEMLKPEDSFILDTGSGLYVWIGKGATQQEKTQALVKAQEFIKTKKYPAWTPVERIVQNAETAPFKHFFQTWRDAGSTGSRLV
ncbi:gelsolin-like [Malaya genurostris]|uniref:gelsolin-like n=1 Tax=Malaya genurostris TaxID=325434 RepID=UPI0026F399BA|nr:gelsolin-like [Malaya genurostris]